MMTIRAHRIAGVLAVTLACGVGVHSDGRSAPASISTPPLQDPQAKPPKGKAQTVRNPLNDLLDEAQAALDKNDYEAAISPLQKFIQEKPEVAYAHFQLAYAYTGLKRTAEARGEYEKCVALDPKMAEAQLNLGILLLDSEPAAAVAPLRRAVELLPSQSRPRFLLGLAQQRSGDAAGAAQSFEGAARLDPNDVDAVVQAGVSDLQAGKAAEAEVKFRHALELQPKSALAQLGLANSLHAQKKPEAVEAYRAYLAGHPDDTAARSELVHSLLEQQDYDGALAELDKSPAANPPTVDTLRLRADVQIAHKKTDDAIVTLKQAIQLAPNDAQLHGGLGRLYLGKREFPEAEKELKAALQIDSRNLTYWKDLSSTYYLSGNFQTALAALDVVDTLETPTAGAWFIRALCYDKLNQAAPALNAYRKFLALDDNRNPDQVWQANQRIHVLERVVEHKK